MIKTSTILLGAGMLIASLTAPLAARADNDDAALAFVVGAAVGNALDDHRSRAQVVHWRRYGYWPHLSPLYWPRPHLDHYRRGHPERHWRHDDGFRFDRHREHGHDRDHHGKRGRDHDRDHDRHHDRDDDHGHWGRG